MTRHSWRDDAACIGHDVNLFLTGAGRGVAPVEAMRICVTCDVREACLAYALSVRATEDGGVYGGTTERDRGAVRAGTKTAAQAMAHGDAMARRRTDSELAAETRAANSKNARRRMAARR